MNKAEYRAMLEATGVSRTDGYLIEPKSIAITWADNPRKDYGTDTEEWQQLKTSIKNEGIKMPIDVYYDAETEKLRLAHGFRRMKAVLELIKEGVEFKKIRANIISDNEETILISHLSLNTGKPLNDVETASILGQLDKRGFEPKEIAEKTGISLQKVYQLLEFDKNAGKALKDAVKEGEIKITAAKKVIKKAKTTGEQETILKKASQTKKKKHIRAKDIEDEGTKGNPVDNPVDISTLDPSINVLPKPENIQEVIKILSQHAYSKEECDEVDWDANKIDGLRCHGI